jgi:ABC-type multidrug transport system fused ATPase/permease subunit
MMYREHLGYAINNLSFVVNSEEKVGIIGRTGSGKSSILATIFRLNEIKSGKILLDS